MSSVCDDKMKFWQKSRIQRSYSLDGFTGRGHHGSRAVLSWCPPPCSPAPPWTPGSNPHTPPPHHAARTLCDWLPCVLGHPPSVGRGCSATFGKGRPHAYSIVVVLLLLCFFCFSLVRLRFYSVRVCVLVRVVFFCVKMKWGGGGCWGSTFVMMLLTLLFFAGRRLKTCNVVFMMALTKKQNEYLKKKSFLLLFSFLNCL